MPRVPAVALTLVALSLTVPAAGAQTPPGQEEALGAFTDWQAIRYDESGRVCSMWSAPKPAGRRPAYAFVAHRPGTGVFHEVSVQFGVPLAADGVVEAVIGKQKFRLYAEGDTAWNPSAAEDLRMVKAMRAGASMTVTATSAQGSTVRDTYSLSGFTAAHVKVNDACGATF